MCDGMGLKVEQLAQQLKLPLPQVLNELEQVVTGKKLNGEAELTEEELNRFYIFTKQKKTKPTPSNGKDKKSIDYMDFVIKGSDVIFIDTSSLLQNTSLEFLTKLKPFLIKYSKALILPMKVYEELQKHQKNKEDIALAKLAVVAIKQLATFQNENCLQIFGDEKIDNFADNVFNTQITRLRVNKSVLLITNDIKLGQDILKLNESKSVNGKKIFVQKVDRFGNFQRIRSEEEFKKEKPKKFAEDKFNLANTIVSYNEELMSYSKEINLSSLLFTEQNTTVQLCKELGKGGEGSVYSTNINGIVAKIYKKEKITRGKFEKLKLMISKPIQYDGICYPQHLLFNDVGEFVGYTMPQAEGKELRHFLFVPKKVFEMRNPDWTRKDLVELSLTILDKIAYLHKRNIILGDINPFNILVISSTKVYFVDVDSYQVEGFPCPVGTDNYTAPEIQGKNYKDFLRTFGHEHFAIATLLFSILFIGKSPYSQTGGESNAENIKNMDFPYTFGKAERAENTPKGQWRYIWSNLPYSVKKSFYETFQKGEAHSNEKTRINIFEWQKIFKRYYQDLASGKLIKQDSIANDIFPNRFKVFGDAKDNLKECLICHQTFPKSQLNHGICKVCLNKGDDYDCARCGKELVFTNYEKYVKNLTTPFKYCRDCNSFLNSTFKRIQCTDCGNLFSFSYKDKEFYDNKGYNYPKRCTSCRKTKNNPTPSPSVFFNTPPKPTYKPDPEPTQKGWCFLTTVACEYYDLPDNCYELETLRAYRDNWLYKQPNGPALIEQYYELAPNIVEKIKVSENYANLCEMIMIQYIDPCVELIQNGEMEQCKNLYINMCDEMLHLTQKEEDYLWKKIN